VPPTDFCWIPNRREVEADAGDFELILVRRAPKIWVKEDGRARPAGRVRDPRGGDARLTFDSKAASRA
jgi:hypothetical protein